jgi:hypothetical protein
MSIKERMDDFYFEVEGPDGETVIFGGEEEKEEEKEEKG